MGRWAKGLCLLSPEGCVTLWVHSKARTTLEGGRGVGQAAEWSCSQDRLLRPAEGLITEGTAAA